MRDLTFQINQLPDEKLFEIAEIAAVGNAEDEEVEIDLNKLEIPVVRRLQRVVERWQRSQKALRRKERKEARMAAAAAAPASGGLDLDLRTVPTAEEFVSTDEEDDEDDDEDDDEPSALDAEFRLPSTRDTPAAAPRRAPAEEAEAAPAGVAAELARPPGAFVPGVGEAGGVLHTGESILSLDEAVDEEDMGGVAVESSILPAGPAVGTGDAAEVVVSDPSGWAVDAAETPAEAVSGGGGAAVGSGVAEGGVDGAAADPLWGEFRTLKDSRTRQEEELQRRVAEEREGLRAAAERAAAEAAQARDAGGAGGAGGEGRGGGAAEAAEEAAQMRAVEEAEAEARAEGAELEMMERQMAGGD